MIANRGVLFCDLLVAKRIYLLNLYVARLLATVIAMLHEQYVEDMKIHSELLLCYAESPAVETGTRDDVPLDGDILKYQYYG